MRKSVLSLVVFTATIAPAWLASANTVVITEFNSNSGDGQLYEFTEFTNVGTVPVDMTGWSQDDSTRTPNKSQHSLSDFGILAPGESAIFTESPPDLFRVYWWGSIEAAPAGLKIIGPYSNDNLSSSGDEINLYDALAEQVDRLTYNPINGGTGNGVTRNGPLAALGLNNNSLWVNSTVGDSYGSFAAAGNPALFGNPGTYTPFVPPTLPGDVNFDGVVNGQDISLVASKWLQTGNPIAGDANNDNVVNGQDISIIASHWLNTLGGGGGSEVAAAVPEPSSVALSLLGLMGLVVVRLGKRRR